MKNIFLVLAVSGLILTPWLIAMASHQAPTLVILGQNLGCYPDHAPNNGGCGLQSMILLIKAVIDYGLKTLILPLAILMLVWAGYMILAAGGSVEKIEKGKKIITVALLGVVIAGIAGIIVGIIYELITGQNIPSI